LEEEELDGGEEELDGGDPDELEPPVLEVELGGELVVGGAL